MPIYEYRCQKNGHVYEKREGFDAPATQKCPTCRSKAQRVIRLLREAGWDRTIHVHGALERLNRLYQNEGIDLGSLAPAIGLKAGALGGEVVIAPPSAIQDRWARRFADPVTAFASGWMGVRARARQRGVELPLVISDHADWPELIQTFEELAPEEIWITHGREEGLLRWAELKGVKARALRLVGYDEDDEETLCEPATA